MSFIKKILFATLIATIFFAILNISSSAGLFSLTGLLMLCIIYLPLFLASFWLGYVGILVILLFSLVLLYGGISSFLGFLIIFFLPVIIITGVYKFCKGTVQTGHIISIITLYSAVIVVSSLLTFPEILSFSALYDSIYFIVLSMKSGDNGLFNQVSDIDVFLKAIVFFSPSMIGIFLVFWIFFNHQLALFILKDNSSKSINLKIDRRYFPVKFYNAMFITLIIITLLSHNLLAKYFNLYYILYNVLLVLLTAYLYLGMEVTWKKIGSKGSILFLVLFSVIFFFMFLEGLLILSIIGFLTAVKIIPYNK